jgi:hypothetical protein
MRQNEVGKISLSEGAEVINIVFGPSIDPWY